MNDNVVSMTLDNPTHCCLFPASAAGGEVFGEG